MLKKTQTAQETKRWGLQYEAELVNNTHPPPKQPKNPPNNPPKKPPQNKPQKKSDLKRQQRGDGRDRPWATMLRLTEKARARARPSRLSR